MMMATSAENLAASAVTKTMKDAIATRGLVTATFSHSKSTQVKDRLNGGKERAKESWDKKTPMQKTMLVSGVLAAAT